MCRDRWHPPTITDRAVVAGDGRSIRLVVYRRDAVAAIVPLDTTRADGSPPRLLEADDRRLSQPEPSPPAAA